MLRISLATWLSRLPATGEGHLLIGATGHLSLSVAECAAVADTLRRDTLPTLIGRAAPRCITLVTGLAPGADLLFKQVTGPWLDDAGIPFEMVALLPVPVPVLMADWLARLRQQSVAPDAATIESVRDGIDAQLARCAAVVDLAADGTADAADANFGDLAFRRHQYRRLAACLAEQADVLIAILRPGHAALPGGASEVVDWRRRPARIPAELSTLALRRPTSASRPLLILNPRPASGNRSEDRLHNTLDACRAALQSGNYLRCHDLAARAREGGLDSRALDYLGLLALANAGSTQLALRRFRELNADGGPVRDDHDIEEWQALKGRLLKDLALAAGPARAPALFVEAGRVYAEAFAHAGGYFPGINAATMLMLGGRADEARPLAHRVLESLEDIAATAGTSASDRYYRSATEAEAALLLGQCERASTALDAAARALPGNFNALSRTRAQLRLICRHLGHDQSLLDALHVPPVLFVPSAVRGAADGIPLPAEASLVCTGLHGPRELDIAEHCCDLGVRVHLVLPATPEQLLEAWQQRHGAAQRERLGQLLERVECSTVQGFLDDESDWCAAQVSATACGLSRLEARRLGTGWLELGAASADAPADRDRVPPARLHVAADGTTHVRRLVGTLFADFAGYSRLPDDQQPAFQRRLIGAIAEVLAEQRSRILLQHTWGDAVHVVTADAATAAWIADRIHEVVERVRATHGGALGALELRLSAHYAPVFEGVDPVEGSAAYFGSQLAFAARIEPVTPPGMIFVTEAFAAQLMLEAPDRYAAEYAGEIELAKRYGKYRLYSLRRGEIGVDGRHAPPVPSGDVAAGVRGYGGLLPP